MSSMHGGHPCPGSSTDRSTAGDGRALPRQGLAAVFRRWGALVLLLWAAGAWVGQGAVAAGMMPVGLAEVPVAPIPGAKVRTPVRLEALLMANVRGVQLEQVPADRAAEQVRAGRQGAWLGVFPAARPLPAGVYRRVLAWSASPMAIMRTDTDIHAWSALRHRTVCLAADGRYVGELAGRFAAFEKVYPSATDALLALRTGQCDATVQDEGFLRQLLKFAEWRKFSAMLTPYRHEDLVALVPVDAPAGWHAVLDQKTGPARMQALAKKQAQDIAFEVYLDQVVPDCH